MYDEFTQCEIWKARQMIRGKKNQPKKPTYTGRMKFKNNKYH